MENHDFIVFACSFALGWMACHLFSRHRRQDDPKKRRRAIPAGTATPRKPGRPKKATKEPEQGAATLPGLE